MPEPQPSLPSFYAGFLKLFSGLALVQLLNLAFSLVLPRYYTPADYALFGLFTSAVFILAELVSMKLDMAVYLPENDDEAISLVHAVLFLSLILFIPLAVLSAVASLSYGPVFILLPAVLLVFGFQQGLSAWFARKKAYGVLNVYRLLQALLTPVLSLVFILVFHWSFGLVAGFLLGQFAGMLYLLFCFERTDIRRLTWANLKKFLQRYSNFPRFGVVSSLINSISRNGLLFFIERFFGTALTGQYTMASRLMSTPAGMYQSALSQVYITQATALNGDALKLYTQRTARFGFMLGILPALMLLLFGEPLFGWIFGSQWLEAGKMSRYIVFWLFTSAIINPVALLVDIKQQLRFELSWNFALLVLRAGTVVIGILTANLYLLLFLFSVVSILMNLYLYRYVLKLADEQTA